MPEFLELLPPAQALQQLLDQLPESTLISEKIATSDASGRILYENIRSPESLPSFPRSTVDGYAVQASSTFGASESLPVYIKVIGECPMGNAPDISIDANEAAIIHTGGMLPDGSDSVVMLEYTQMLKSGDLEIMRPVAAGENMIKIGEDILKDEIIIPARNIIRAAEIGGLLSLGISEVRVLKRPLVGIISSGDEVIPPEQQPRPGQVRDINSYTLSALVEKNGGTPKRYGIAPDNPEKMLKMAQRAFAECDTVVITAGSSASARDHTSKIIECLGHPGVLVHGVNVRPGKPTILAVCSGKPVIGLPGNPVSALVIATLFVVPVMKHLMGIDSHSHLQIANEARLSVNINSQTGREDWIPVQLHCKGNEMVAEPIFYKSNLIFSLVSADALAFIPADANGLSAGETVMVYPLD